MARDLVIGVLAATADGVAPELAEKLRDFTLACCRFDYTGPLLEAAAVDDLLAAASQEGARYCLVQAPGHAMVRQGDRQRGTATNLIRSLSGWLPEHDFLVAGRLLDGGDHWSGLDEICFAVDLAAWRRLGRPRFTPAADGPLPLPAAAADGAAGDGILSLRPAAGQTNARPGLPGWGLIAAALEQGLPVPGFDAPLRRCGYDLRPRNAAEAAAVRRLAGDGIFAYESTDSANTALSDDWRGFLDYVHLQAKHAKRGVFLGNFEGYGDIAQPPSGFAGPVSGLYAVAAGFKANRTLATHGFDRRTRMVFFDYSPVALDIRRALVQEWDGTHFPAFIEAIAPRFPDAFYQLWGNLWATRPGALDLELVTSIWDKELAIWGGAEAFRAHWEAYREIPHRFVHCDLFAAPEPLLAELGGGPREVMWWSNAFHSLNGVWFYPRDERHRIYRRWLADLAGRNPDLLLYGTDVDNLDLGGIRIRDHRASVAGVTAPAAVNV
jgi:hypothetical protein